MPFFVTLTSTLTILTAVLGYSPQANARPLPIVLAPGEVAIVGYGSLIDRESMSRTLGQPFTGRMIPVTLLGFERDFSAVMPNHDFYFEHNGRRERPDGIAYFNVRPKQDSVMRAVLFVVPTDSLARFDFRERIYRRIDVRERIAGYAPTGAVYLYEATPEHRLENFRGTVAIRETYLETVASGLRNQGEEFERAFWNTTAAPPPNLPTIADRIDRGADPFGYRTVPALRVCGGYFATWAEAANGNVRAPAPAYRAPITARQAN